MKGRKTNRHKFKIPFILKLLYIVILTVSVTISFSMARYAKTLEGTANANSAKWIFKANEKSNSETFSINLADTLNESTLYDQSKKVVAPSASGYFEIVIDATGCQTAFDYSIKLVKTSTSNLPEEITFFSNQLNNNKSPLLNTENSGESEKLITGTFSLDEISSSPTRTYTIDWLWQVNNSIDESNYQGQNFEVTAIVTGTQKTN